MFWNVFAMCAIIIVGKILEVSIGTFKMMVTVKGKPLYSACMGFVEAIIWFLIVKNALVNAGGVWIILSYALGYSFGIYIGGFLAKKLIKGMIQVQVITKKNQSVVDKIREEGFGVTVVDVNASNHSEEKYMLFIEITSDKLENFKNLIKSLDEKAFIMVSDTKQIVNGYFGEINK